MNEPSPARMVAEILDNIRRVFQVVNEQSKLIERQTGLTGPQVWAIKTVAAEGSIRVSDLARRMYLHPATVVGIIDRLEKRDLLTRSRSTEDRRVVEVSLTPAGEELVATSPEVSTSKIAHGLEQLDIGDLALIYGGLDRLVTILEAKGLPPQLIGAAEVNIPDTP